MTNAVVLNNVTHKDLRVVRRHSPALNEPLNMTLALPFEFRSLQHEYPLVFIRNDTTHTYQAVALLGFEQQENLYLNELGWDASYIPLMIERQPFLIGMQPAADNSAAHPVLLIDMDSPKVSEHDGEPLFLPHGGHSEYLQQVTDILATIRERESETQVFYDLLARYELLEPFFLDVTLDNQTKHRLTGYYTINEERLSTLPTEAIAELHQQNVLPLLYYVLASHSNFRSLIDRKQAASRG